MGSLDRKVVFDVAEWESSASWRPPSSSLALQRPRWSGLGRLEHYSTTSLVRLRRGRRYAQNRRLQLQWERTRRLLLRGRERRSQWRGDYGAVPRELRHCTHQGRQDRHHAEA